MSHVVTIEMQILDLKSLEKACEELGLEFVRGQETYRWYGTHVGDYPIPQGFTQDDLGRCEHAIRVPGDNSAYEIGVTKRRDGKPGWTLIYDFWGRQGRKIEKLAGSKCASVQQEYAAAVAIKKAGRGYRVRRRKLENGTLQLTLTK